MWPLEDIDIIRWSGWRARSCKAVSIWDGRCKDLVELLPLLPVSQLEISAIPTLPLGLVGLLQWLTDPREMGLSVSYQYITNSATKNKTATWWTRSVRSGLEKKPEHPSPLWVCHSLGSSTCSALQRLPTLFSLGIWWLCYKDTIDFITCHWQFTYLSVPSTSWCWKSFPSHHALPFPRTTFLNLKLLGASSHQPFPQPAKDTHLFEDSKNFQSRMELFNV